MIHETNLKYFIPDYTGTLPDHRLEVRAEKLARQLSEIPCSSIRKLSNNSAEHKANLRFLNNERVEEEALIKEGRHERNGMNGSTLAWVAEAGG